MEKLEQYREIIKKIIKHHAQYKPSRGEIQVETIFDEENDHYELMHVGWNGPHYTHGSVLHIDIRGGKVWIQFDGTYDGVANDLVEAGIPRDRIVLGFKSPEIRPLTDFAVA